MGGRMLSEHLPQVAMSECLACIPIGDDFKTGENRSQGWMIGARSSASLVPLPVAVDTAGTRTPEKTSSDLFPEIVLALSFPVAKLSESWILGRMREQKVRYSYMSARSGWMH